MKLFYFNPNFYGIDAVVCAESIEEAKEFLRKQKIDENDEVYKQAIHKMINCLDGYTIEEYEPGMILFCDRS